MSMYVVDQGDDINRQEPGGKDRALPSFQDESTRRLTNGKQRL